jgi:hypothetical protein
MGVMGRSRRDKRKGLTGMRDHLHMSTSAIALEQRFMFDAAGVATAADAVVHDPTVDALFDTTDHSVDQQLLDAAAQATELLEAPPPAAEAAPVPQVLREADPAQNDGRTEVVFIDTGVTDWQVLAEGVKDGVEVVLLDSSGDGLAQMAAGAWQSVGGRGWFGPPPADR